MKREDPFPWGGHSCSEARVAPTVARQHKRGWVGWVGRLVGLVGWVGLFGWVWVCFCFFTILLPCGREAGTLIRAQGGAVRVNENTEFQLNGKNKKRSFLGSVSDQAGHQLLGI